MVQAVSCFSCCWLHDQTNHSTVWFHWKYMLFGSNSPVNLLTAANNHSQELPCSISIYSRPTGCSGGFPLLIRPFLVFCVFPVWHAETDCGRAEEASLRYFPWPPHHERHWEHHHDWGEPPEQSRVPCGHWQYVADRFNFTWLMVILKDTQMC